jgi:predicted MFS family arabinose efflux permease
MTSTEKFVLAILACINFVHIMDAMIIMPLGDIFMKLFQINPTQFAYLVSAYSFAAFFSSLLAALVIDRFDRRMALIFVFTGFTIGTLLCGIANSYLFLLGMRFVTGFFGGVMGALALSIVSDMFSYERRGTALGILTAGFSAAAALGVPCGLFLADKFTWNAPFITIGGLGGIILIFIIIKFPRLVDHMASGIITRPKQIMQSIFYDRNQVNALILGMVLILGHYIIIPFIAPYMTRNVGFSQSQITLIYFFGGVLTVFTSPFVGKLTDRFTPRSTFSVIMLLSFVPVIWITHMKPTPVPVALIATSLLFILGSGRMIAPQTMITASVGPTTRGSFMSIKSALQQLAIAVASILSGGIITFGEGESLENYNIVGYISIILCVFALFLSRRLRVVKGN